MSLISSVPLSKVRCNFQCITMLNLVFLAHSLTLFTPSDFTLTITGMDVTKQTAIDQLMVIIFDCVMYSRQQKGALIARIGVDENN